MFLFMLLEGNFATYFLVSLWTSSDPYVYVLCWEYLLWETAGSFEDYRIDFSNPWILNAYKLAQRLTRMFHIAFFMFMPVYFEIPLFITSSIGFDLLTLRIKLKFEMFSFLVGKNPKANDPRQDLIFSLFQFAFFGII